MFLLYVRSITYMIPQPTVTLSGPHNCIPFSINALDNGRIDFDFESIRTHTLSQAVQKKSGIPTRRNPMVKR